MDSLMKYLSLFPLCIPTDIDIASAAAEPSSRSEAFETSMAVRPLIAV